MSRHKLTLLVYAFGLVCFAVDQWTKHLVMQRFLLGEVRPVIQGWLALTQAHNTGAAWSMFADNTLILGLVSLAVCLGMLVYERRFFPRSAWQSVGLGLLLGGAAGNMVDRFRFGYVVDMIYVQWQGQYFFPIFNVADVGINVGVGLLLLIGLRESKEATAQAT